MTTRHDQEHPFGALTPSVRDRRGTWNLRQLPVVNSLEPSREQFKKSTRRARSETVSRGATPASNQNGPSCIPWLARHSGWCVTRYLVKPSARTPFETLKNQRYSSETVCVAETVCACAHGDRDKAEKLGTP